VFNGTSGIGTLWTQGEVCIDLIGDNFSQFSVDPLVESFLEANAIFHEPSSLVN
jgi:hypothetical protein